MIEKTRVRSMQIGWEPDGSITLHSQIEDVFVDEQGGLVAVKPGAHTSSRRVDATSPVHELLTSLATLQVEHRAAEVEREKKAVRDEAQRLADAAAAAAAARDKHAKG